MIVNMNLSRAPAADLTEQLRELIVAGALPPKKRLTQRELAEHFGVSQMPVRDAIKQLMSEGLVTAEGPKTIVVSSLSARDFVDLMEIRLALEPRALELAIPIMTSEHLRSLRAILKRSKPTDSPSVAVKQHWTFHRALYAACDKPRLLAVIDVQHLQLSRYLMPNWGRIGVEAHWAEVEGELLDLIHAGTSLESVAFLREDLERTIARVVRVLT